MGVAPLAWNDTLARIAQAWSDACVFEHSTADLGENLARGPDIAAGGCGAAVDLWMTEPLGTPGSTEFLNHASQVVWPDSTDVGCGFAAQCAMVTCNYYPPGNLVDAGAQA